MRRISTVTALFLVLACVAPQAPQEPPLDLEAEREALMAADEAWAEASAAGEDPHALNEAIFLDDAIVLAPGAPIVRGKEESLALFAEMESLPGYSLHWTPTIAEVGGGGDLGYTIGTYHMEFDGPDGNRVVEDGKYLSTWKKVDGEWKLAAEMFNSNGEAPGAE